MLWISKQKFFSRYLPMFLSVVLIVAAFGIYLTLRPQTPAVEAGWYGSLQTISLDVVGAGTQNALGGTSATVAHTVTSGAKNAVVVCIAMWEGGNSTISGGATYNGNTMVQLWNIKETFLPGYQGVAAWIYPVGTGDGIAHNCLVNFGFTASAYALVTLSFSGVDQVKLARPAFTYATGGTLDNSPVNLVVSNAVSGDMVIDGYTSSSNLTDTSSQTLEKSIFSGNASSIYSSIANAAGSTTMGYTFSGTRVVSYGAAALISAPSSWLYRKALTVNHTKVNTATGTTTPLTNFPVLYSVASGTVADLKFTGSGGKVASSTGADILFTDSNGTSLLNYEIEKYASSTGELEAWVKIPSLPSTADYTIYMYYGNASASDQQAAAAVWSPNYQAVYHLKEDPSGAAPQIKDSTSNANNGTSAGSMASSDQVAGQIDGSLNFPVTTKYVTMASTTDSSFEYSDSFSVSCWVQPNNNTDNGVLIGKETNVSPVRGWMLQNLNGLIANPYFSLDLVNNGNTTRARVHTTAEFSSSSFHYVVATYSGNSDVSGMHVYVDGSDQVLTTQNNNLSTNTIVNALPLQINARGASPVDANGRSGIDECRVSKAGVVLSADWIKTEYNNQSSPLTFWSSGPTLSQGQPPQVNIRGGTPSNNALSLIQHKVAHSAASATTVDVTVSSTGAGNLLVVGAANDGARTVTGVSDGTNNFTQATNASSTSSFFNGATDVWYLPRSTAGKIKVTITFSGSAGTFDKDGFVWEVSGFNNPILDLANNASNQTANVSGDASGSAITTTATKGFLVGVVAAANGVFTNPKTGNEFSTGGDISGSPDFQAGASLISSTAASHQPVWTVNASDHFGASTAAFKEGPSATPVKFRGGGVSISYVQKNIQNVSGGPFTLNVATTSRGDLLVVNVVENSTVTGVTDNAPGGSNTYTEITNARCILGGFKNHMFYSANSKSGATVITAAGAGITDMSLREYSGAAASNPLDVSNHLDNVSTASNHDAGATLTINNPKDVLIENDTPSSAVTAVAAPWTNYQNNSNGVADADYFPGALGSYSASFTDTGGTTYCSSAAAFLPNTNTSVRFR